jgi:hypothetical protein
VADVAFGEQKLDPQCISSEYNYWGFPRLILFSITIQIYTLFFISNEF